MKTRWVKEIQIDKTKKKNQLNFSTIKRSVNAITQYPYEKRKQRNTLKQNTRQNMSALSSNFPTTNDFSY